MEPMGPVKRNHLTYHQGQQSIGYAELAKLANLMYQGTDLQNTVRIMQWK